MRRLFSRDRTRWLCIALPTALVLVFPAAVAAHRVAPDQVIALLRSAETKRAFDIRTAERDPKLPRLLVVRVGADWSQVPAERRRAAAEHWQHLWRGAVANGILAILDAVGDEALVNFDAEGRALLRSPVPRSRPTPFAQ